MLVRFRLGAPTAAEVTSPPRSRLRRDDSAREFLDRPYRDRLRPRWPLPDPGLPRRACPVGVLVIDAALVLRDLVQRRAGIPASLACVVVAPLCRPSSRRRSGRRLRGGLPVFRACRFLGLYAARTALVCAGDRRELCGRRAGRQRAFSLARLGSFEHFEGQVVGKIYAALAVPRVAGAGARQRRRLFRNLGRATRGALGWGSRSDLPFALDQCSPWFLTDPTGRSPQTLRSVSRGISSVLKVLQNP